MSPAEAKMAARAAALAQEQALRRAQPVVDTRQLGGSALSTPQFQPPQDTRQLGGAGLTTIPLAERQAMINLTQGGPAQRFGSALTQVPIEQRQAYIDANSSGSRFGQGLNTPAGPVRPPQMNRPGQAPQRAPQQRTGGPGQGPVRPQQGFAPQQRAPQPRPQPQQRPEPSFMQQAMSYAKPVTAGLSALGSLFSFF